MNQPAIEVKLIAATDGSPAEMTAEEIMVYTKATRLEQGAETREKIVAMSDVELANELAYMANTIPSSWEFVDYVFEIRNVTRAFTHQFVRTRTGSYAQQTMRLLNKKEFTYRIPPRLLAPERKEALNRYEECMGKIQMHYDLLIESGVAVEDARGLLPTNIHTNIIAKFNLRTLSEMAKSRTGARTQDEYREVMELMLEAVVAHHPWAEPFLFPEVGLHLKALEVKFDALLKAGAIEQAEWQKFMKHLDAFRKGGC